MNHFFKHFSTNFVIREHSPACTGRGKKHSISILCIFIADIDCFLQTICKYIVMETTGFFCLSDFFSGLANHEQFFSLSRDLDALALGSYFCELLATEGEEDVPAPGMLRLALNSLYALAHHLYDIRQIKAAFELRFLAIAGYEPDLWKCAACGADPEEPMVNLELGQLHCAACRGAFGRSVSAPLSRAALQAARYVLRCDLKKLFSFRLEEGDLELLGAFAEAYCLTRLERGFQTLDFYRSLGGGTKEI